MDIEKWKKHFTLMSKGLLTPTNSGKFRIGNDQRGGVLGKEPSIHLVTQVAQAVELAKSELKEERKQAGQSSEKFIRGNKTRTLAKRKSTSQRTKRPKKQRTDFFSDQK